MLARVIARAHLRRVADRSRAMLRGTNGERPGPAPHGPPPEGEAESEQSPEPADTYLLAPFARSHNSLQ